MAQRMQWSLPGHSGHGRTFCWLDPVANDPCATSTEHWGILPEAAPESLQ